MKYKLIKLISVTIIAAFAWQNIVFADGSLRPLASQEKIEKKDPDSKTDPSQNILGESMLDTLFASLEKYALERLNKSLEREIPLVSGLLQRLSNGRQLETIHEMLGLVLDSLQQTNQCLKLDYANFPGLNPRQEIWDSLRDCLEPACRDLVVMFDSTKMPAELRNQFGTLLKINMATSLYAEIYLHAAYLVDNRQVLADFTKWLNLPENRRHLEAFAALFNTIVAEVSISTKLSKPVQAIHFRDTSIIPLVSVVGAIAEFLSQQKTGAAPKAQEKPGTFPKGTPYRDINACI